MTQLANVWAEQGYHVLLYTDEPATEKDYWCNPQVKRIQVKGNSLKEKNEFLKKSLLQHNAEYFVDHVWCFKDDVAERAEILKDSGIKYLVYIHGLFNIPFYNFDVGTLHYVEGIKKSHAVLCLNRMNFAFFAALGCRTLLTNNPIQPYLLDNDRISDLNGFNLLWIGRNDQGKHFSDALEIFCRVRECEKNARLHVVGDISLKEELNFVHIHEEVRKDILFYGFDADVAKYYLNADLMLLTSEAEGYCYTLLESKCFGVPVVMYNLPYLSLVKDYRGITSVQMRNTEEAAAKVCLLLSDRKLLKEQGRQARESFEYFASYDCASFWYNVFDDENIEKLIENEKEELGQIDFLDFEHITRGLLHDLEHNSRYINVPQTLFSRLHSKIRSCGGRVCQLFQ